MACLDIEQCADRILFSAKIVPGSSKTAISGTLECALIHRPPERRAGDDVWIGCVHRDCDILPGGPEAVALRFDSLPEGTAVEAGVREVIVVGHVFAVP